mmetsp:Transcript_64528/g.210412  ORF Transcript_64528/g.210412 Transcript_64528/m.210412 type:complete len:341 (-) Transcript_64528:90-1112(-)
MEQQVSTLAQMHAAAYAAAIPAAPLSVGMHPLHRQGTTVRQASDDRSATTSSSSVGNFVTTLGTADIGSSGVQVPPAVLATSVTGTETMVPESHPSGAAPLIKAAEENTGASQRPSGSRITASSPTRQLSTIPKIVPVSQPDDWEEFAEVGDEWSRTSTAETGMGKTFSQEVSESRQPTADSHWSRSSTAETGMGTTFSQEVPWSRQLTADSHWSRLTSPEAGMETCGPGGSMSRQSTYSESAADFSARDEREGFAVKSGPSAVASTLACSSTWPPRASSSSSAQDGKALTRTRSWPMCDIPVTVKHTFIHLDAGSLTGSESSEGQPTSDRRAGRAKTLD